MKSELRHLKKQVGRANKATKKAESVADIGTYDEVSDITSTNKPLCDKCNKPINIIELGVKLLYNCINPNCKFRKTITKSKLP